MGEALMDEKQLEQIGQYVKSHMKEWVKEGDIISFPSSLNLDKELIERIVCVEEGLKQQGETLKSLMHQMDKRFEQVDKRFEDIQRFMEQRFEQVDKRFEYMQKSMDKRFEMIQGSMDKRFDQVDKRFNQMFAYFTTCFVIIGALITVPQIF